MNIALVNENVNVMNTLTVDIIKTMRGSFTREDLERELINLSYNKVIVDITSIKNYYDEKSLFNFLTYWEPERVILVLNETELCNNPNFLGKLVEKGFYNFTKNSNGVAYLINKPNTLNDVKKLLGNIKIPEPSEEPTNFIHNKKQRIIGLQGLTNHAGCTTLMYMMIKILKTRKKVIGIEVGSKDSNCFKTTDIITASDINDLTLKVKTLYDYDVIIIDLNGIDGLDICTDTLYLLEPGTIRLNKLIKSGKDLSNLSNKVKIVLNRSTLNSSDIANFEYETRIKVFANLNDFNDRADTSKSVENLLSRLRL